MKESINWGNVQQNCTTRVSFLGFCLCSYLGLLWTYPLVVGYPVDDTLYYTYRISCVVSVAFLVIVEQRSFSPKPILVCSLNSKVKFMTLKRQVLVQNVERQDIQSNGEEPRL